MRTYEELTGARGREMFYRAERFKVADLFKRAAPALTLEADEYLLQDISITGLAATTARGTNHVPDVGERVAVRLGVRNTPLLEAKGEVVRRHPAPTFTKLGLSFVDRGVDIGALVTRYHEALVRADLDDWEEADAAVSADYQRLCADVLHLFRTYRAVLDCFEATKPDAKAAADMLAACEERIMPRWRGLWERGNQLVSAMEPGSAEWRAAKRYTELIVTPDFILGPFGRRCYEKPLGYPGDYEAMNMVYDWRREGGRLSDKLLHRVALEVGECIGTRMIQMRHVIAEAVAAEGTDPVRVTCLGCGPAREVIDFLKIPQLHRRVAFTLIDQDRNALSQAYERTLPEVMRHRGRATVAGLHASFAQLLSTGVLFGQLPPQDLIYSVGLIDYLTERRAKALVKSLYEHVAPGGRLVVSNMKSGIAAVLWPAEFLTDWTLTYRDAADLLRFGAELSGAEVATAEDPTGRVCILSARKP